jgi:nucleotide-binding universal stress UspA family protein
MKILIAYDGSPAYKEALRDLRNAGLPAKANVRILSAVPPLLPLDTMTSSSGSSSWYASAYAEAIEYLQRSGKQSMLEAQEAGRLLQGFFPSWIFDEETCLELPAKAILKCSEAWKPNLLVLGSRVPSGMERFLQGSVSSAVAAHASCSIEVIRKFRQGRKHEQND